MFYVGTVTGGRTAVVVALEEDSGAPAGGWRALVVAWLADALAAAFR
jgi:hypothetical protein